MIANKENPAWDPENILAQVFYEPLPGRGSLQSLDDAVHNGRLRPISGLNAEVVPMEMRQAHREMLLNRIESIKAAFIDDQDAHKVGDLVDFDKLEDTFPWSSFLAMVTQWSRLRLSEISRSIKDQGGIGDIVESLADVVKSHDSQIEISYDLDPSILETRQLLPAADIKPAASGQRYVSYRCAVRLGIVVNLRGMDRASKRRHLYSC